MINYSITNIIEKNDENMEKNKKLFKKLDKYDFVYDPLKQIVAFGYNNNTELYDNNNIDKKFIYKYHYQLLGTYNTKYKIWLWGWAKIQKNINYSKKLLIYGLELGDKINNTDINNTNINNTITAPAYINKKVRPK
jgi:CRISPR/Cas system-associated protein Cas5 (RAMP superfamily)